MQTIERFVVLLYDRTSTSTDVNKARCKLFAKKGNVELIPPTSAALKQHVRRAVYQGGHVWGQALVPAPALPSPGDWWWSSTCDQIYEPYWTTLPEASKVCQELISCTCKKGFTRDPSSRKQNWNVQHCAIAEGSAWITEVIQELNLLCSDDNVMILVIMYNVVSVYGKVPFISMGGHFVNWRRTISSTMMIDIPNERQRNCLQYL